MVAGLRIPSILTRSCAMNVFQGSLDPNWRKVFLAPPRLPELIFICTGVKTEMVYMIWVPSSGAASGPSSESELNQSFG